MSEKSFAGSRSANLTRALNELRNGWEQAVWLESPNVPTELFHYCGVDAFHSIVSHRTLWLSDVLTMNDSSEILYARDVLDEALSSYNPHPTWLPERMTGQSSWGAPLYVSCFCEAGNLLSQWRGYGAGGGGFAIGFDFERLKEHARKNQTTLFRMLYDPEVQKKLPLRLIRNACETASRYDLQCDEYREFSENFIALFSMYLPQLKDPSFREELEWRLMISGPDDPKFRPAHGIIVPYVELAEIPGNAFKSVTLGPTMEPKFGLRPTKLFLESNEMEHVEVRSSKIRLRALA
jgi:hypothetical protein